MSYIPLKEKTKYVALSKVFDEAITLMRAEQEKSGFDLQQWQGLASAIPYKMTDLNFLLQYFLAEKIRAIALSVNPPEEARRYIENGAITGGVMSRWNKYERRMRNDVRREVLDEDFEAVYNEIVSTVRSLHSVYSKAFSLKQSQLPF